MKPLAQLYTLAADQNIPIYLYPLPLTRSMSVMDDAGACAIGMDPGCLDGNIVERMHLSHELGHCITGSFYNIHAAVDCRRRHENRADRWAIRQLIPLQELDDAIAAGHIELWELADHFGVTEDLLRKALCLYVHGNLAAELYF